MIVISDTTPINYLVLIGCAELLPALYQRIVVPEAVFKELQAVGPSNPVGIWLASSLPGLNAVQWPSPPIWRYQHWT